MVNILPDISYVPTPIFSHFLTYIMMLRRYSAFRPRANIRMPIVGSKSAFISTPGVEHKHRLAVLTFRVEEGTRAHSCHSSTTQLSSQLCARIFVYIDLHVNSRACQLENHA